MPNRRVRPAQSGDARAIASLVASPADLYQVAPQESYPLTEAVVAHWIESRAGGHVLEAEGEILAYAELIRDAAHSKVWWIGHVVVHELRRGRGIGRELVGALARAAAEQRAAAAVWISVFADNPVALRAYQGVGFHIMRRRRFMGRELIDLQLWLDPDARTLSRRAVAVFAGLAGVLSLALLPGEVRAALADELRLPWWLVLLSCAASSIAVGLAWRPALPDLRGRGIAPLWRPMVYGLGAGISLAILWSLADLGLRPGRTWDPIRALSLGLQYGAGWGLIAVFVSQFQLRLRSIVPPGPAPFSDRVPR
jgi:ribosomal protein S18 acetylase RimI-like enzyme